MTEPTAVQRAILELPHPSADVLVSAQTGSGKTIAFGLALATNILGEDEYPPIPESGPLAVIIAPTRELALQVCTELSWLFALAKVRITACVGGTSVRGEQLQLKRRPHIVVGTPGRLCDHLKQGSLDLKNTRAVVLDEADEMLDMGFRDELEQILNATATDRRTLMFSATMPKGIELLAKRYQKNAVRVSTQSDKSANANIEYVAMVIQPRERVAAVVNTLRYYESHGSLVFCATRDGVAEMHQELSKRGFSTVQLSGELSQRERNVALASLKDGRARICIATDVAARGIDVSDLDLVIHADLPQNAEVMVHRSGRTGRAGRAGVAVLIVPTNRRGFAERVLAPKVGKMRLGKVPTAKEIAAKDMERLQTELATEMSKVGDQFQELAKSLIEAHSPMAIASLLISAKMAKLPATVDIGSMAFEAPRGAKKSTADRFNDDRGGFANSQRGGRSASSAPAWSNDDGGGDDERSIDRPRAPLASFREEDFEWFSLNIGKFQKAEPKWLIPLLCRRGGISKPEIGHIEIGARKTRVAIARTHARMFAEKAKLVDPRDPHVKITPEHSAHA